ncbi:hypothetical protein MKW92_011917 [Papaver armeniacum]|nr:hypothetical protein MKW92_011917 [Papaver armeniacum]
MKNKEKNPSSPPQTTNQQPLLQPNPHPHPPYTFMPSFYPPPTPWSTFPGPWSVHPPPSGFPLTMPIATPPHNLHQHSASGHSLPPPPPPYGFWPPPPPMMMGPVISTSQNHIAVPTTGGTQESIVPPTGLHRAEGKVPPEHQHSEQALNSPLRRRPVTRRSAAQDLATDNASSPGLDQLLDTVSPSLTATKGSQSRQLRSQKIKDKEEKSNAGQQDKVEGDAAFVDENNSMDVTGSLEEVDIAAETSGREDDNVPLPKLGSEPFVGLRFSSEDEAYEFYNAYAKEKGFSIRKSHIQRSRVDRSVISREYVCANQGFRSTNDRRYKGKVVRPRRETRVDCRAAMSIKRRSTKWIVDKFHKEHNHGLVDPAKAEKLRSHRKITQTTKSVIDTLYKCRIGPSKIIDVLTKAASEENTVEISGLDLMKYVKRKPKNNIAADCYHVLEYFQKIQAVDPGFFYAVEVGDSRSMRSMFWADSRSRDAYRQFGDVMVFDHVCRTNKDLFPFVSFVGVNHHRQPVLFGCGLLADETVESFVWLFKTLLRAMSNCHPTSVITKQDKAIMVAMGKVFPNTRQRICMLHIEKNELENLSEVFNMHPAFQEEYKRCIYNCQKPEEFESGWKQLLVKYNLKENSWLYGMYDQRHNWVPLYLRNTFFAGMSTTQLAEGMNSYFDGFLHEGTPLNEFIEQYELTVVRRREEETDEDFITMYTSAGSSSKDPIEEQAAKVYTRNMFTLFGHEFLESSGCIARKVDDEDECTSRYLVGKYGDKDDEMSFVTFNSINKDTNCSCQMFEFEGILCKHVLKLFQDLNIVELPAKYTLKRWTMIARYGGPCGDEAECISEDTTAVNVWKLKETAVKFVEIGLSSADRNIAAMNIIEEGLNNISLVNASTNDLHPEDSVGCSDQGEKLIDTTSGEPQPIKTKEWQASVKEKLGVKQVMKKNRKCSTCKKSGHYTSTCPKVLETLGKNCGDHVFLQIVERDILHDMVLKKKLGAEIQNGRGLADVLMEMLGALDPQTPEGKAGTDC